jgi:hypothetical protein
MVFDLANVFDFVIEVSKYLMIISLILILIGYEAIILVNSVRLPLYNAGNELEQFYRYISIVELVGKASLNISTELRAKYDKSIYEYYQRSFYGLRNQLYDEEHPVNVIYTPQTLPSLWNRTIIPMDSGESVKYAQDCDYRVVNNEFTIKYLEDQNNFFLTFIVEQSNCRHGIVWSASPLANDMFQGGSSFDILWESKELIAACSYIDHFNNTYSIFCPVRTTANILNLTQGQECGTITTILQYEHYDAFDNKGKLMCLSSLNRPLC